MNNQEKPTELENPKTIWHTERFIRQMEHAIRYHPVPYKQLPDVIELDGIIAESINKIYKETMDDPVRKERAMHAKTNAAGKLLISNYIDIGDEDVVSHSVSLKEKEDTGELADHFAFGMHTHGILDVPASMGDLKNLLANVDQGGAQAEFVITPTNTMLFIRSLETPELDPEEAIKMFDAKNTKFITDMKALRKPHHELIAIQTKANIDEIQNICRQYRIAIYNSFNGHRYTKLNLD